MVYKFFKRKRRSRYTEFVDPDEIILDSTNLENFDQQQFEGRIEIPIRKSSIIAFGVFFAVLMIVFSGRLFVLQVKKGESYFERSENNTLANSILFAERGIIYDRNNVEMAWNKKEDLEIVTSEVVITESPVDFPTRSYMNPGFSHILGHVSVPAKDAKGFYWQTEYTGKDGLEFEYNDILRGINGSKVIELDALGNMHSENTINAPIRGRDLVTSIDSRIQSELFKTIKDFAEKNSFVGGAGIMMDVHTGEIIASTSYPEYDNEILSSGSDKDTINSYLKDTRNVFMDRTISGLYTPGSIVKPIFALAALEEGIISPLKEILSTGSISLPNPYFPDQPSIFRDWKAHGYTDLSEAIAVSSDVYFYTIGGGFEGQKGLGIARLEKYAKMFGLSEKTNIDLPDEKFGVIPSPDWKAKNFKDDPWRVGDTYHTSIGQYGFQVTPIEMVRATGALANGGTLVTPHFVLGDTDSEKLKTKIEMNPENLKEVQTGMREAVIMGTAGALNVPYIQAAAKTGTAQVGISKKRVNSWVIGYFPYENPKYAFTIMMESGPSQGETGASWVMRGLFDHMYWETPEYFGLPLWPELPAKEEEEVIEETEIIEILPEVITQ